MHSVNSWHTFLVFLLHVSVLPSTGCDIGNFTETNHWVFLPALRQWTQSTFEGRLMDVKPTRCTISQIYFILEQHSTCFGRSLRPSSGVSNCTHSIRYMFYRFSQLPASGNEMEHLVFVQRIFLIIKPTRCTMSQIHFISDQHSTSFGRSFRPSSGV